MARPLRLEYCGALWHIRSRGNEKQDIVRDDTDRESWVSLLGKVVCRFGWILHAYVLMTNHYHLLLETPEPNLSRGMQRLNGAYAQRFNRRHGRTGHLFEGRFAGSLVQQEAYLLEVVRYIVLNPVRARMVALPEDYEWSSFRATTGLDPSPEWLDVVWTLQQFHRNDRRRAVEEYRRFVLDRVEQEQDLRDRLQRGLPVGDREFHRSLQSRIDVRSRCREHPRREVVLQRPSLDGVLAAVAEAFDVSTAKIVRRGRSDARLAVAIVSREDSLLTLNEIAQRLNVGATGISHLATRARGRLRCDPAFRARVERARHLAAKTGGCRPTED